MNQSPLSHLLSFIVSASIISYMLRDKPTGHVLLVLCAAATGRLLFAIARGPARPSPLQRAIQEARISAPRSAARVATSSAASPARGASNWPPSH